MALTVTEREHWRQRIEKRIDRAIEATYCVKHPTLLEETGNMAREQACELLGIDKLLADRKRIVAEKEQAEKARDKITKELVAVVRGCRADEVELGWQSRDGIPGSVEEAIEKAARSIEDKLLAKNELGSQVLALRREKEELLDTVWLATSGKQIKELWSGICTRLDQEPSQMQAFALSIATEEA